MSRTATSKGKFDSTIVRQAALDSLRKLNPVCMAKNPVMMVVEVCALIITVSIVTGQGTTGRDSFAFNSSVAAWLWLTILFANFAESIAEGRGKAQAKALKGARLEATAKKLSSPDIESKYELIKASELRRGDYVVAAVGDVIPGDGEVVEGIAFVDESAITGESAPVLREAGGDRSSVTGGTKIISDWLIIKITANPGETFLDRMISMVEGAKRKKTPNEIALSILLSALSLIFLLVTATLYSFMLFAASAEGLNTVPEPTILISLLVCLIPTTIGGLLSAIGIAGMDRLIRANVIAFSGRAVEAAGDIDLLLLDKTGTITLGNRQATKFHPIGGVTANELADAAQLASISDETPEGRSIVILAKNEFQIRVRDLHDLEAEFIPFTAQTKMSGVHLHDRKILKGSLSAICEHLTKQHGSVPEEIEEIANQISRRGATPLVVIDGEKVLGLVELKDVVKGGIRERFAELRKMGIKTVMVTGDNKLTAATIAAEAGVDDYLGDATPEEKLDYIRAAQAKGFMVAMTGDGTNDAPALAQADVAVAMNSGTQPAKEASNMVDLDSSPTKLIEIVEIGKQLLMTRGALTTFSIANDVAKYFAIIPAAFTPIYPELDQLNLMRLSSPESAIMSAVIFNAISIPLLLPIALKGITYRPLGAEAILCRNLLVYGLGGIIAPFLGIKLVDQILAFIGAL